MAQEGINEQISIESDHLEDDDGGLLMAAALFSTTIPINPPTHTPSSPNSEERENPPC